MIEWFLSTKLPNERENTLLLKKKFQFEAWIKLFFTELSNNDDQLPKKTKLAFRR